MSNRIKYRFGEDPAECGRYISYLYRKSGTHFASEFKKIGLSPAQSIVMVGICRFEGVNQQVLSETISMTPGVVSRVLRELEDKHYVEKIRDEQNRRNYNLYLTPEGSGVVEHSLSVQREYWNHLVRKLSAEEVSTLNGLLQKMEHEAYGKTSE